MMGRLFLLAYIAGSGCARSQESVPPAPEAGRNVVVAAAQAAGENGFSNTQYAFFLTILMAITGIAVIGILVSALKRIPNIAASDISRPIIVVTVIIGTIILITAGFSNTQIAPAFGLFGTIIGYILGRSSATAGGSETPQEGQPKKPGVSQGGQAENAEPKKVPAS